MEKEGKGGIGGEGSIFEMIRDLTVKRKIKSNNCTSISEVGNLAVTYLKTKDKYI